MTMRSRIGLGSGASGSQWSGERRPAKFGVAAGHGDTLRCCSMAGDSSTLSSAEAVSLLGLRRVALVASPPRGCGVLAPPANAPSCHSATAALRVAMHASALAPKLLTVCSAASRLCACRSFCLPAAASSDFIALRADESSDVRSCRSATIDWCVWCALSSSARVRSSVCRIARSSLVEEASVADGLAAAAALAAAPAASAAARSLLAS
jgi:hypothetical protein